MHAGAALLAGGQHAISVRRGQSARVEQERRRCDVLAAGQDRAYLVKVGGAGCVEHTVGGHRDDLGGVGGGEHADRIATDECAHVAAVFGCGVHLGPDQLEAGRAVEDRDDHLGANRAGAPLDDSVRLARRRHIEARFRGFDHSSITM